MGGREKIVCGGLALVLIALLVPLVFMQWGFLDLNKRQKELADRRTENRSIAEENRNLEKEIRRLNHDPAYLEFIARKELGMVAEDEIVVKFHGKDTAE
ncbi:FtsB family cell division protein [Desulfoluna butyratoxydans]|uniref:Septum formation initiator ftsl/divic n=1 Tax=Desulfoluna butyratoxydans TaxID=231438 RepID=A0A4U8YP92_9BACT|nr:septum formation initiator family protein [Desulfoluna butyratoxydans]VFQ45257.1 septum formation initiator ftsl/divic [Desulfoluna butyratoxydans]